MLCIIRKKKDFHVYKKNKLKKNNFATSLLHCTKISIHIYSTVYFTLYKNKKIMLANYNNSVFIMKNLSEKYKNKIEPF